MPFNSLLLSKDSETVQVLGRVLKDLDIRVEHCTEPFNAAKLLMDQRFDAIIVDCDNAQGAAWVLQSARTAAANKAALTVAIVPDQHSASKLGENFVLHKPIVASQAESTLKAARNLMKPGASSAPASSLAAPVRPASPSAGSPFPSPLPEPLSSPLTSAPVTSSSGSAAGFAPAREPAKPVLPSVMAEGITTSEEVFRKFPVVQPFKPSPKFEAARRPTGLKSHITEPDQSSTFLDHRAPEVETFRSRLPVVAASEPKSSLRTIVIILCVALALAAFGLGWRNLHSAVEKDAQPLQLRAVPLAGDPATEAAPPDQLAVPSSTSPAETTAQPSLDTQQNADKIEKSQPSAAPPKKEVANESIAPPAAHASKSAVHTDHPSPADTDEPDAAPPSLGVVSSASSPNIAGVVSGVPVALPTVAEPTRVTISQGVSQGMLIHQVNPVYPPMAKQARIQGEVLVRALINKQGEVEDVKLVSGPSLLVRAALTAVKQWRYRPYLLNGQAVQIETLITLKFTL